MRFNLKYWHSRPGDEPAPGIVLTADAAPCAGCGHGTRWYSAVHAAPCCSNQCLATLARQEGRLRVVKAEEAGLPDAAA